MRMLGMAKGRRRDGCLPLPLTAAHCRPGPGLQVQRPELIDAEHNLRVVVLRDGLAVGDRVQLLDPGLLRRVLRVLRRFPGLYPLDGDALLAEQHPQAKSQSGANLMCYGTRFRGRLIIGSCHTAFGEHSRYEEEYECSRCYLGDQHSVSPISQQECGSKRCTDSRRQHGDADGTTPAADSCERQPDCRCCRRSTCNRDTSCGGGTRSASRADTQNDDSPGRIARRC